jgi:beta-N-acetylhexosaminidase
MMRAVLATLIACGAMQAAAQPTPSLDRTAERWVDRTQAAMSLDEKLGQLVMPAADSTYTSSDSDAFDGLRRLIEQRHVGGFIMFGGREPAAGTLFSPATTTAVLGDPLSAASTLNRLQRLSKVPLLNAGDFEFGVGMRIKGATSFPLAMAFGATGDPALAEAAARATAEEMRSLGLHMNFAPVADINNNPRNPVINTRSFGQDPVRVGEFVAAAVRGLEGGGVLATLKHFPGHGDTDVDTHLGLATIAHDRAHLDAFELIPFRAGERAGASAVMTGHLEVPDVESRQELPASLSHAVITGLLRTDLHFQRMVVTDSLSMDAVAKMLPPGDVAAGAIAAGSDLVLDPPDPDAAIEGLRAAVADGRLTITRLDESVRRVLIAKARLGLHLTRTVDLERIGDVVGTRAHRDLAVTVSARAVTLVGRGKEDAGFTTLARTASVLSLSLVDYAAGWRAAAPGRTFGPELRARWPKTTVIELTDRSAQDTLDLVRAMASHHDAIVIATYVRSASGSGRLDLPPPLAQLAADLARTVGDKPIVACLFGNPYVAGALPQIPLLLTYSFGDVAERTAVRALAGEIQAVGTLPVSLPDLSLSGR